MGTKFRLSPRIDAQLSQRTEGKNRDIPNKDKINKKQKVPEIPKEKEIKSSVGDKSTVRRVPYVDLPPKRMTAVTEPVNQSQPKEEPTYKNRAPVEIGLDIEKLVDSVMDMEVTVPLKSLAGVSGAIQKEIRKQMTKARIQVENQPPAQSKINMNIAKIYLQDITFESTVIKEDVSEELLAGIIVGGDPVLQYMSLDAKADLTRLTVGKMTEPLRAIYVLINGVGQEECLLDGGSMIVSMSKKVAVQLGLGWDPAIRIDMESASNHIEQTLGVARNVTFEIGGVKLFLQVHILENPPYRVLLGKPFERLANTVIQTYDDGSAEVVIRDPNSKRVAVIPTYKRGKLPKIYKRKVPGFLIHLEESVDQGGEVGLIFEYNRKIKQLEIKGYTVPKGHRMTRTERLQIYMAEAIKGSKLEDKNRDRLQHYLQAMNRAKIVDTEKAASYKYKPVALKVKPLHADLPEKYRIIRDIRGDPLENMPVLNPKPPDFVPTGRYTQERKEVMDAVHKGDFLLPEERKLIHHLMMEQEKAFAWDDSERGSFRTDFFPPVVMPVVDHTPWVYRNIPIPAGIYPEVCKIVQKKLDAGVYEPSNASYRSRWFTVAKKDGKSLRIVHSLEPLNAITIAHSGVPPATEELASKYAGRACGGMLDLYVGYDERLLDIKSRDMTTFQTPFGALRLVTLPMGWTNSVPIFHEDVTAILKLEIPKSRLPILTMCQLEDRVRDMRDRMGLMKLFPKIKG